MRVHAHARLVQEEQARRAEKRAGDTEFLLHAAGKAPGQPLREGRERREGEQPPEERLAGRALHAAQAGVKFEVRHDREVFVQAEALRHVADAVGRAPQKLVHGEAEDAQGAPRGQHKPGEQAHEGGLARGVRPHEAGDAPGGDGRRDALERLLAVSALAESHAQILKDNGGGVLRNMGSPRRGARHGAAVSTKMVTGMPWRMTFSGSSARTRSR